ncbi:MAG: heme ABC transporter ATP-binding protein [Desulfobacterales bacterium]|nr:heme ABC transporter ATP-binding protein [Desulfobacterales bacterium]
MTALKIEDLSYSYGKDNVLKDISFSVQKGEFFIIIGPNGSGKTTLLKTINSIIRPMKGRIEIYGHSYRTYTRKAVAQVIAFVPQEVPADFPFTVREVVLMGRTPHLGVLGLESEKDKEIAEEAMSFTHVSHIFHRKLSQLSGGERQRVFIARAVCQEPRIILLDEPTASLDLAHQVRVMDLMEKLKNEKNITVIMISHDVNLAAMYGDRLLLLRQGQIMSMGRPENVLTFETLEKAYGCVLMVKKSPLGDFPQVILVPQKFLKGANISS